MMLPFRWLGALLLAAPGRASEESYSTSLNASNFDEFLNSNNAKPVFVMFRYSWCQICNTVFPAFESAAADVTEQADVARRAKAAFADIECNDEAALCQRFGTQKFPALKIFQPDAETLSTRVEGARDLVGQRSREGFFELFQRFTKPPVRYLGAGERLDQAVANETMCSFVATTPSADALPAGFESGAKRWQHQHSFIGVKELPPDVLAAAGGAGLVAYSPPSQQWAANNQTAEGAVVAFKEASPSNKTLLSWASRNRFLGIWRLNDVNIQDFLYQGVRAVLVGVDPRKSNLDVEASIRTAMRELPGSFSYGVADAIEWREFFDEMGVYRTELPGVVVIEAGFEVWIQDKEMIRLPQLAQDLRAFLDGAPVMRNGRTMQAKIDWYIEDFRRKGRDLVVGIQEAPLFGQLGLTALALLLFLYIIHGWWSQAQRQKVESAKYDAWQKDYLARAEVKEKQKAKEAEERAKKGISAPDAPAEKPVRRRRAAGTPSKAEEDS